MKPSEIFWSNVPEHYMRGEAQQDLAFLVLRAAKKGEDEGCNGFVCDALTFALNRVWEGREEEFKEALDHLENYEDFDEEDEECKEEELNGEDRDE